MIRGKEGTSWGVKGKEGTYRGSEGSKGGVKGKEGTYGGSEEKGYI